MGSVTVHTLIVGRRQNVAARIVSFAQQTPMDVAILSAVGTLSAATLYQPCSRETITYEGSFELLNVNGSFCYIVVDGARCHSGGLTVILLRSDGRVMAGSVAGSLIAANPVQVIMIRFPQGNLNAQNRVREPLAGAGNLNDQEDDDNSVAPAA